jgi:hypothetical protein
MVTAAVGISPEKWGLAAEDGKEEVEPWKG